jgi:hypothetical protein
VSVRVPEAETTVRFPVAVRPGTARLRPVPPTVVPADVRCTARRPDRPTPVSPVRATSPEASTVVPVLVETRCRLPLLSVSVAVPVPIVAVASAASTVILVSSPVPVRTTVRLPRRVTSPGRPSAMPVPARRTVWAATRVPPSVRAALVGLYSAATVPLKTRLEALVTVSTPAARRATSPEGRRTASRDASSRLTPTEAEVSPRNSVRPDPLTVSTPPERWIVRTPVRVPTGVVRVAASVSVPMVTVNVSSALSTVTVAVPARSMLATVPGRVTGAVPVSA